jgi:Tfp pilus assembly protein FimT
MGFMQMLTANFWTMVVLLLFIISIVSIVLGIALEAYKSSIKSRQKMMELRNEEMRLQLQLQQQRSAPLSANIPMPKDPTWAEHEQSGYQMGYQQQMQG